MLKNFNDMKNLVQFIDKTNEINFINIEGIELKENMERSTLKLTEIITKTILRDYVKNSKTKV
jgi:hypothetical protein